ncbi:unnamed protein product [Schistosoma curassoni]|uniref:Uncharacterized protein n=1 Tax=Schistosoma curassoni TaxID=6186 RepID=A0A183KTE9_9TREM|nr:unnamed protein product [Schistosoma curassoni]
MHNINHNLNITKKYFTLNYANVKGKFLELNLSEKNIYQDYTYWNLSLVVKLILMGE